MEEPTYKEHKLLEQIAEDCGHYISDEDHRNGKVEEHYKLVRKGLVKNLVVFSGGWKFRITDEGEQYLEETKD